MTDLSDRDAPDLTKGIVDLYLDVQGRRVASDGPEVLAIRALWSDVAALSDPKTAWAGVLAVPDP